MNVPQIDVAQADAVIRLGATLLDVREPDEWAAGHAPQATHVPLGRLAHGAGSLDRTRPVVVVCRSGRRSDHAATVLRNAGFDARNLTGGMQAWQQAGGPVIDSNGQPGAVI